MARPVGVLLVASDPVQYGALACRRYAADPRLDISVAHSSLQGAQPGIDPELGVEVAWDVPLLSGYRLIHPRNLSPRPGLHRFWGALNPGFWPSIRRGQYDVVVCYGWRTASSWIAALAAKASGSKLVFSTDAHVLQARGGQGWKVPVKRILIPLILQLADGAFVPSSRAARFLREMGSKDDRIFSTPYVVDNDFSQQAAKRVDRTAGRMRLGVPSGVVVALFVGKLVAWKRPLDLLEAASRVEGIHVVVAGAANSVRAWSGERTNRTSPAAFIFLAS